MWTLLILWRRIFHSGDFPDLLPHALTYFFRRTLVQKEGGQSEVRILNLYMIEKLQTALIFLLLS